MDNCRIYVCKSLFGQPDECYKFDSNSEYKQWLSQQETLDGTSFQPICNCHKFFDRFVLAIRSKKIVGVKTYASTDCGRTPSNNTSS